MSDIQAITVPKWGLTMEEGTVAEWLVAEGQPVHIGDEIMEMETSKIVNTVEAVVEGTLRRQVAKVGETLPIAGLLGVLADASVSDAEIDTFIASYAQEATASTGLEGSAASDAVAVEAELAPAATSAPTPEPKTVAPPTTPQLPASLQGTADDSAVFATVHARKYASELGVNLTQVTGSGRGGRISRTDVDKSILAAGGSITEQSPVDRLSGPVRTTVDDSALLATPVARRLARELGINLHECRATGSRGRVCKADVETANALLNTPQPTAGAEQPARDTADRAPAIDEIPMTGMRRAIATRLQSSKQTAPHFRLLADCELDALLALRQQINAANPAVNISVNDFVVKACATALAKIPDVNIQFDEATQTIRRFSDADIAVAVAIEGGLITPIVRQANKKTLSTISNEIRDLATRAKAGTLRPEEFQGGTFSISNLGMFGVKQFDAIINPPQAAILAVGGAEQRLVVKDGAAAVATVMTVSLAADHRIIDGALGAQFMQTLKSNLQNPALMLA